MDGAAVDTYGHRIWTTNAAMPKKTDRPGQRRRKTSSKDRIRVPRKLDSRSERELNQPGQSGKKDRVRDGSTRSKLPPS